MYVPAGSTFVFATGALDAKVKELIALAIAVSKECDGCIAAHAHGAAAGQRARRSAGYRDTLVTRQSVRFRRLSGNARSV